MNFEKSQPDLESRLLCEQTRRHFFGHCGVGLGALALNLLLKDDAFAAPARVKVDPSNPLAPRKPMFPAKAKNVIFLFMAGGPSHLDLFDDKPKLRELHGQSPPPSLLAGKRFAFLKGNETLLGCQRKFERVGRCGVEISELL